MPKVKKESTPKKEVKEAPDTPKDEGVDISARFKDIEGSIETLAHSVQTIISRLDERKPETPKEVTPEFEDVVPVQSDLGGVSSQDIVAQVVQSELGDEFTVEKKTHQPGVSFRLHIIPPERLRDNVDDRHVKVIPYMEAEMGTREYAKKVKKYHIERANRMGLGSVFAQ